MTKQTSKATKRTTEKTLTITAPRFQIAAFTIVGIAPYVQNKFSAKAREKMRAKQEAGSTKQKGSQKEPKDFRECYEGAIHRSADGWCGIPAPAFRNAMIDACRMVGFTMTHAKCSLFVEPDGFDADDGTPLVRITSGDPEYSEMAVRNEKGVCDIRPRPMWREGWLAEVRIRFDLGQFTLVDVGNLLMRAGLQVGVGEGRPFSKKSAGMGWGLFRLSDENQ